MAVWLSQDFSKLVIFDGLPNSGKFKKPSKLKRFVEKFLSQLAEVVNVEVQLEADGETAAGAAIVEFKTAEMALEAVNNPQANGTEFQGRVFQLNLLKDMDKYEEMSEEFEEPEIKPFVTSDDLYDWMSDKSCRDQFVIRYDRETEIFWSETKNAPVLSYGGDREKEGGKVWVHLGVEWSPQGTYLVTWQKFDTAANFPNVPAALLKMPHRLGPGLFLPPSSTLACRGFAGAGCTITTGAARVG